MSGLAPGTLIQVRTTRRFAHYYVGEIIALPPDAARDLVARRLAEPLAMMVPAPPLVADPPAQPQRQPMGTVRK
jgi:hypothetical protein